MVIKEDVVLFFGKKAATWDEMATLNSDVVNTIMDNAGVSAGSVVLDVGCGTGILFPTYIERKVSSLVGVDMTPEMVEIAKHKFNNIDNVSIICSDIEETEFNTDFDVIMVYNAFPHFADPDKLIRKLSSLLKDGGRLSIAHGMSREKINQHKGMKGKESITNGLISESELSDIFSKYLTVDTVISNENMYQVVGHK